MSQEIWDVIDPTTTSGTELADLLNKYKNAAVSGYTGINRPANLQAGGYWIKNSDGSPLTVWTLYLYDGTKDISLMLVDTINSTISFGSISNSLEIKKVSVDNIGPFINLVKSRGAGVATAASDILAEINFKGKDASDVEYVQARVVSVSTDTVTSTSRGSYIAIETTKTTSGSLVEVARFANDGNFGIGISAPTKRFHAYAPDANAAVKVSRVQATVDAPQTILHKKRIATNGQVLQNDLIGEHLFVSTDENGNEIEVAKLTVKALENHTGSKQGVEFILSHKKATENTFTEAMRLSEGAAYFYGQDVLSEGSNIDIPTSSLLDDSVTRNLFSIDGTVYGAFTAEFFFFGRDNSNTDRRKQRIIIEGIYDAANTEWDISYDDKLIKSQNRLINLDDSNSSGKDLVIDYINQITAASFLDGKIYGKIRRSLV